MLEDGMTRIFNRHLLACSLSTILAAAALVTIANAADLENTSPDEMPPPPKKWEFILGAYGFVPWVTGNVGTGSVDTDLSLTGRDVLDALRFGVFLDAEALYDNRYSAVMDVSYANLGGATDTERGNRIRLSFSELIIEGHIGYRFVTQETSWLEAYGGVRYWDVSQTLSLTGPLGNTASGSAGDTWIDPIIGLRGRYGIAENWGVIGQGDIGGFGIGSDFSWRAQAGLQRQFQNGLAIELQYKALQADFDNGKSGSDRFVWDVIQHGPLARLSYRF
jgi:hypothetical protein